MENHSDFILIIQLQTKQLLSFEIVAWNKAYWIEKNIQAYGRMWIDLSFHRIEPYLDNVASDLAQKVPEPFVIGVTDEIYNACLKYANTIRGR